jgi:hypothetical protein
MIKSFSNQPSGYDFAKTYADLESAYSGQHSFDPRLAGCWNSQVSHVAVANAKYLIESFVLSRMSNSAAFINNFGGYSSTVGSSIATSSRALDQLLKSAKFA